MRGSFTKKTSSVYGIKGVPRPPSAPSRRPKKATDERDFYDTVKAGYKSSLFKTNNVSSIGAQSKFDHEFEGYENVVEGKPKRNADGKYDKKWKYMGKGYNQKRYSIDRFSTIIAKKKAYIPGPAHVDRFTITEGWERVQQRQKENALAMREKMKMGRGGSTIA